MVDPPDDVCQRGQDARTAVGIDVGGSFVKFGVVDDNGAFLYQDSVATAELRSVPRVLRYVAKRVHDWHSSTATATARPQAVGLAVPGVLDPIACQLREVVNLPGWLGVDLNAELQTAFRLNAAVLNDANAAALAEHQSRGLTSESLALVTLGTGVGCGLVVNGRPHGGDHGCAGELGHIAIEFGDEALPCTCGGRGHLESYVGASALVRRFAAYAQVKEADLTPRDIALAAERNDSHAWQVIEDTAERIGRAIGMLGQTIDPDVVLLGGAMTFGGKGTKVGERFLDWIRQSVVATTLVQVGQNLTIDFASHGNQAGLLGAANFSLQRLGEGGGPTR
ncbi:MAG: ROK family protein [Planctomycetota bacterium]